MVVRCSMSSGGGPGARPGAEGAPRLAPRIRTAFGHMLTGQCEGLTGFRGTQSAGPGLALPWR